MSVKTAAGDLTGEQGAGASRRPLLWWDLAVCGVVLVLSVPGSVGVLEWQGQQSPAQFGLAFGVLLLFVVLYALLGRPALRRAMRDLPPSVASLLFLGVVAALTGLGAAINPSYASLQVLGYPLIWNICGYGRAVAWSGALALACTAGGCGFYTRLSVDHPALTSVMIGVLSFIFAVAMGTWITRIYQRGERHRELAEQLRATQAEVVELSQQAGVAAERERLSRELHDTLTQTLAGLVMLSEQADRALAAGDADRARDRLARVSEASRAAVEEARALVATTQPLSDGGLEQTAQRVAARFAADTGMKVTCELEHLQLDRERQIVLLRAVQEGLANARKHSQAEHVRVELAGLPGGGVLLTVEDDGVGPEPHAAPGGFGLSGLADRVRTVGGEVRFAAAQTGGARLEVSLSRAESVRGAKREPS